MFSVIISERGGEQSRFDFSKPEVTIGRMKGNDIVLSKTNISKQHTRIILRDETFYVIDLNSTNGTYVDGIKVISEQAVSEESNIVIGDFILKLERSKGHRPQPGGPPAPPQPPGAMQYGDHSPLGAPMDGPRSGGRHFPTLMDGPRSGAGPYHTSPMASIDPSAPRHTGPQQPQGPHRTAPPARHQSAAGGLSYPSLTPPPSDLRDATPTPAPGLEGGDLRRTIGDVDAPISLDHLDFEPAQSSPSRPKMDLSFADSGVGPAPSPAQPPAPAPAQPPAPAPPQRGAPIREPHLPSLTPEPLPPLSDAPAPTIRPMLTQKPLQSEFDEKLHMELQDLAQQFLEQIPAEQLPLDYPIGEGPERARVEEAVSSAITAINPRGDRQLLKELLIKEALGLGPLEDYLDDNSIQSIYVNAFDRITFRRAGNLVVAPYAYSHPKLLDLAAKRLLGPQEVQPVFDEVQFSDGTRVHILMPPVAVDGPALTIRKPIQHFPGLDELVSQQTLSEGMAEFLRRAVQANRSIIIAGPTSSGKTTLLAALVKEVPEATRLIAIEQNSNIPLDSPSFIRLVSSPSAGLDTRFLLNNAVAMHPERIVLDECRGSEAYEWVTAAASGTEGSMLTLHGLSALDALGRLESMCLMGTVDTSPRGLREQIARSVDLVVVLNTSPQGGFFIQEIAELQGVDLDAYRVSDVFYRRVEGASQTFHPTGYIPLFYEDLRHAGAEIDLDIFRD